MYEFPTAGDHVRVLLKKQVYADLEISWAFIGHTKLFSGKKNTFLLQNKGQMIETSLPSPSFGVVF